MLEESDLLELENRALYAEASSSGTPSRLHGGERHLRPRSTSENSRRLLCAFDRSTRLSFKTSSVLAKIK